MGSIFHLGAGNTAFGRFSLGGRGTSVASSPTPHIANETARYGLTGIAPGYVCIQDDTGQRCRYKEPSTAAAGYFVAGGAQDGIYTIRGQPDSQGYRTANLLGAPDAPVQQGIFRMDDDYNGGDPGWAIADQDNNFLYYSNENVVDPSLCNVWIEPTTRQPIALKVTPVTQGELDAGVTMTNNPYESGIRKVTASYFSGRISYTDINPDQLVDDLAYDRGVWAPAGIPSSPSNVAFPWQADWSGNSPVPSVTRNDVASAANWVVVM